MSTIHNPVNFVPEDYSVVSYLDNRPPEALEFFLGCGDAEVAAQAVKAARTSYHNSFGRYFGFSPASTDDRPIAKIPHNCDHCGAHIRYVVVAYHEPSKSHIAMGETCAHRVDMTLDEHKVKNLHDVAKKRNASIKLGGKYQRFLSENPELAKLIVIWNSNDHEYNEFVDNVLFRARQYGTLSEKQIESVSNAITRHIEYQKNLAERKAAQEAKPQELAKSGIKITEGCQHIEGTVLAKKWKDDFYGGAWKMLVESPEGLKFWGTVPSAIEEETERGDTVKFDATVQTSDDPVFGFFKRPSKAANTTVKAA